MEILVGQTFGIDTAAYVRGRKRVPAQDKDVPPPPPLFTVEESRQGGTRIGSGRRIRARERVDSPEESSDSSSSIGAPEESIENDEKGDDVVSSPVGLNSLTSLEDSLPIKRGLSNHYTGKSKSFGNLMEARNVKDLEKVENPLNKKRRLMIANNLGRRRSISSSSQLFCISINPNSKPLLAMQESHSKDHEDQ